MTILAPAGDRELGAMLDWALSPAGGGPVIIRYPKASCPPEAEAFSAPLRRGRGVFVSREDASLCLAFTGGLYPQVLEAARILASRGVDAALYNLRFLKPVDEDYLAAMMNRFKELVFIEEGTRNGGFGEYAAALKLRRNCSARVLILAAADQGPFLGRREELLRGSGLDGPGIAASALAFVQGLAKADGAGFPLSLNR
jgi:1-deoxy-D-xylulose-5-phosphate synthase